MPTPRQELRSLIRHDWMDTVERAPMMLIADPTTQLILAELTLKRVAEAGWVPPEPCKVCGEQIVPTGRGWKHVHSSDQYCGTGDGAMAEPVEVPDGD